MSKDKDENKSLRDEFYIENSLYYTEVPDSFKNRIPWKPINDRELKALIPGTILEIFVEEGQKVTQGQQLLTLEAMKMRNMIISPFDAEIKSIKVKSGEIVPKDTLLIEFL